MRTKLTLLGATLVLLLASGIALGHAQQAVLAQGGHHELPWWTSDAGGGTSSGGGYTLHGIAGQPEAGTLSDGTFTLSGGFWVAGGIAPPAPFRSYLPVVLR